MECCRDNRQNKSSNPGNTKQTALDQAVDIVGLLVTDVGQLIWLVVRPRKFELLEGGMSFTKLPDLLVQSESSPYKRH
jgi:hypothetical protein